MQKSILLSALLSLFLFSENLRAQVIPNGGFENWTYDVYFENPTSFFSTNFQSFIANDTGNVTRAIPGDNTPYGIRLETVVAFDDTIPGLSFYGTPGTSGFDGGLPYTGSPDSLTGSFKCNIQPNDTGTILIFIRGAGQPLAIASQTFTGQTNNWTNFATAFTWINTVIPPDSITVIFSSSLLNSGSAIPGSVLELDEINLSGPNGAPIMNGSFEFWDQTGADEPDDWKTINFICDPLNPSATLTSDAYAGSSALKIETVITSFGDTLGLVTNGYFGEDPLGGMSIMQNPVSITGYYKYLPVGPDTALIGAYTYVYDAQSQTTTNLDSSLVRLAPTSTYQSFTMPFFYNGWNLPDTLNITISSSNIFNDTNFVGLGSVLIIDELSIQYSPVGEPQPLFGNAASPYPVPASAWLTIPIDKVLDNELFEIFDAMGRRVFQSNVSGTRLQLDVHEWSDGVYFYRCNQTKGQFIVKH